MRRQGATTVTTPFENCSSTVTLDRAVPSAPTRTTSGTLTRTVTELESAKHGETVINTVARSAAQMIKIQKRRRILLHLYYHQPIIVTAIFYTTKIDHVGDSEITPIGDDRRSLLVGSGAAQRDS